MRRGLATIALLAPLVTASAAPELAVVDDRVSYEIFTSQLRGRIDAPTSGTAVLAHSRSDDRAALPDRAASLARVAEPAHAVAVIQTLSTSSVVFCGLEGAGILAGLQCALDSKAPVVSISQAGLTRSLGLHIETVVALAKLPLVVFSVPNRNHSEHLAGFVPEAQDMRNVVFAVSVNRQGRFEPWVLPSLIPKTGVVFAADGNGPDGIGGNSLATPRVAERLAQLAAHNPSLAGPELVSLLKAKSHSMAGFDNVFVLDDMVDAPGQRHD